MRLEDWIDLGTHIFPLKPGTKHPATPNGYKDAANDASPWQRNEDFGVGIATGEINGFWVLDIDDHDSWNIFRGDREIPETFTVRTPSGGMHYYFSLTTPIPTTAGKLAPGVDTRSDGGYVVAPPTKGYEVVVDTPPVEAPLWLVDAVLEVKKERLEIVEGTRIPTGQGLRHGFMVQAAQGLADLGIGMEGIRAALSGVEAACLEEPLPESEFNSIVTWASTLEPNKPIDVEEPDEPITQSAAELLDDTFKFLDDPDALSGLPTGFETLDRLFGGGKRLGELTITQAPNKTGKNTLWHHTMINWLKQDVPIGYACREMIPSTQVMPMMASMYLGRSVYKKPMDEDERARVKEFFKNAPLYFAPGFGAFHWEQFERWVKTLYGIGVRYFFVDHLHYLLKKESHEEAAEFGRNLKRLTNTLNIHVDLIVQPSKLPQNPRTGEYFNPSYNTLRGGANIGQVCDNLINMWRVKQGDAHGHMSNVSCLHVELMRYPAGRAGKVHVKYDPDTLAFYEVEFVEESESPSDRYPDNSSRGPSSRFKSLSSSQARISSSPVDKLVT